MFGLLIFIPLTAVIILKSTRNYKCDCKRDNSVLLVYQYYEEPFLEESSLKIEEPFLKESSLKIEELSLKIEEPSSEHSLKIEESSYDPDMKLIFASNMLFANSTKNNHTIFEEQIQIQIPIWSQPIMYFVK